MACDMIREMTAAERTRIMRLLGRPVIETADALRVQLNNAGHAPAGLWRNFLQSLMDGAGEAMETPVGVALQLAIVGKIQGDRNDDRTSEPCRAKPSGGFPGQ